MKLQRLHPTAVGMLALALALQPGTAASRVSHLVPMLASVTRKKSDQCRR